MRPARCAKYSCGVATPAAKQQVTLEVTGRAFRDPQQVGVILALVIVGHQPRRPVRLDVPGVDELVRCRRQETQVALARLEHRARELDDRRIEMLGGAAGAVGRMDEEHVALERIAAPDAGRLRDDLLEVGSNFRRVVIALAPDDDVIVAAAVLEAQMLVDAGLDRRIGQHVPVAGDEAMPSRRAHARDAVPAARDLERDGDVVGAIGVGVHEHR